MVYNATIIKDDYPIKIPYNHHIITIYKWFFCTHHQMATDEAMISYAVPPRGDAALRAGLRAGEAGAGLRQGEEKGGDRQGASGSAAARGKEEFVENGHGGWRYCLYTY